MTLFNIYSLILKVDWVYLALISPKISSLTSQSNANTVGVPTLSTGHAMNNGLPLHVDLVCPPIALKSPKLYAHGWKCPDLFRPWIVVVIVNLLPLGLQPLNSVLVILVSNPDVVEVEHVMTVRTEVHDLEVVVDEIVWIGVKVDSIWAKNGLDSTNCKFPKW